jgi:Domain of unknown function (DUF4421)
MKKNLILFVFLFFRGYLLAQHEDIDTTYIEDLSKRIFVSYFQEYQGLEIEIEPDKNIDDSGREKILLNSATTLLSGFLFQYKWISFGLASTLPQSEEDKQKYGVQNSNVWKINLLYKSLGLDFNHIKYQGFYDVNFTNHQYAPLEDITAYSRFQDMDATWINVALKYYPKYKKFSQGLPNNFQFKQRKSKFALGYKLQYNNINLNNKTPFFSPNLILKNTNFDYQQLIYNGFTLSSAPSLYLTTRNGNLFFYADSWLGVNIGEATKKGLENNQNKTVANISLQSLQFMAGVNTKRLVIMAYYKFNNQYAVIDQMSTSNTFNTFGLVIGYRFKQPVRWLI